MNDKQIRAEIESRTAQRTLLGIKSGSIVTDEQGRTSAIGYFRWEPVVFKVGTNEYAFTGERCDVEVQVYRPDFRQLGSGVLIYRDRDGNPWLPTDGEDAIRAAAMAQSSLAGRKSRRGGQDAHDKTYGTPEERAKTIAEWQRVVDEKYQEDPNREFIKELCAFASSEVPQPWNGKLESPNTIRKHVKNPRKKSLH
jgi:hypothetical protein